MSIAVDHASRASDLADLLPIPCETCAPARGSEASYSIEFDVIEHGELVGQRWCVCADCVLSCLDAVEVQHQGFTLPVLAKLRRAVLAA